MKQKYIKPFLIAAFFFAIIFGCTKKLDLVPTNDVTADKVYSTALGYKQALAKVFGAMATTGNTGPFGSPDIPKEIIADEGASDFLRVFWWLQEVSTDEAAWTYFNTFDPIGIHQFTWSAVNQTVGGAYYRSFFLITLANDFIRQASDANISSRGITGTAADSIKSYRAEARYLRAFHYWVLMDLFANPPFVTENDLIGVGSPRQISRSELFNYIESELKDLENVLPTPRANEYGRPDRAAAWALLSRMYLNANIYTGTARYTDAITYCNKIINAGYTLHTNYKELMLADNDQLRNSEFIFTIPYDGTYTQTYGGTTLLMHGPSADNEDPIIRAQFTALTGIPGRYPSWGCIRVTQQFVSLFPSGDIRGQFFTNGQNLQMTKLLGEPRDGYSSTKFRNVTRTGGPAPHADPGGTFSDIDFPLFRLAETYLIYAEAVLRGGTGGSSATALGYLDQLSLRGRNNVSSNAVLTLPYILDERARELFWEGFRRTDLIRYGQFTTGTYLWAWKGGVPSGTAVDSKYNIFPIPSIDLSANSNLKQNPGY